jgi:hypothetical protein
MNRIYKSIKQGLEQAMRHQEGKRVAGLKLHNVIAKKPQADLRAPKKARA